MDSNWNDNQPIYRQLRDKVVAMILEGALGEGDALPSVRSVAAEHTLNPLTVLKGYQQLVDEGLVEKRRGRGMSRSARARICCTTSARNSSRPNGRACGRRSSDSASTQVIS
jgi:DNA-binding transcriptional regulator YhcF (GntR family)